MKFFPSFDSLRSLTMPRAKCGALRRGAVLGILFSLTLVSLADEPAAPATAAPTAPAVAPAPAATAPAATPVVAPAPAAATAPAPATKAAPKFVILIPEEIDAEWYWYYYSDMAQHIVQSAIEKSLIQAGYDVIDLASIKSLQEAGSIDKVMTADYAKEAGKEAGADYAIVGKATAMKASENEAYGITVIRSQAEITAKIIRISDGKVLDVVDASANTGGQAQRVAGQEALKKAAPDAARKLIQAFKKATGGQ